MTVQSRPLAQEWFTAREVAELKLRDLPTSESAVVRYAARKGWNDDPARCRNRTGRGGGLEYHLSLIPTLAWADYHQRTMTVGAVEPIRPQPALPTPETDRARTAQAARMAILTACEIYAAGINLTKKGGYRSFEFAYNCGQVRVEDWVREEVPKVSARTLFRWLADAREGKSLGVDRALARQGKGILETANGGRAKAFVLGLIAHQPGIKAERIQTLLSDEMGGSLIAADGTVRPIPPVRTIQNQVKIWRTTEAVALAKLSDPDRYRSTMEPSGVGMLRHVTAPNQLWMIDSSPLDAVDAEVSRPTVYACVDVGPRRMILYVSRTPRAAAVAMLLRKALLAWGVPKEIKTDNGSDFAAEDTKRLAAALDIELKYSDAYSPKQKGHVERAIKTMQHGLAELLPGYVGHNVAERKRLEDRKGFAQRLGAETAELFGASYTIADIQKAADRWIELVYEQTPHSALKGKTPVEAARQSGIVIRTVDERALDVLLMPVAKGGGYRKVTKFGVQIGEYHYQTIKALPGDRVMVRMDPNDLGVVYLFDEATGAYVELAVCPELRGIDPAEYTRMVKQQRAALLKDKTDPIRAEVRQLTSGVPMIERYLNEKERQLRSKGGADIVQLPTRTIEHVTPEIAAALTAATGEAPATPTEEPLAAPPVPAEVIAFPPRPVPAGTRPTFKTDQDMAAWLLANPAVVTDRDRSLMADRLRSWTFRELCSVAGVDVDALSTLIKTHQQEAKS
ncbi:integrase [Pleomorphomonas diazotrophica]|uniref:Integrase n=1 Tax=Pleomorphomonas diazotrophica TaxID=1166257 RepID=A0A1I4Q6E9_9HYPH|nr:DDE-type integrase/transposase/recombinase [Pleomorphomonas diazotrophica]PKR90901.1 integrase [Pleomorphomonas diazotrophica]SFM35649.1 Mu transposase, C-terminal [Pleomorphomonas diazotrophica]